MSEAFLERLSRFTPDAGGLDRDALLFEAGRKSARPNRSWLTAVSLLAGTQALSLALLWSRSSSPAGESTVSVAAAPKPATALDPPNSGASANPGIWSARHSLLVSETEGKPVNDVVFIDVGPPLRPVAPPPPSLLN